MQKMGPSVYRVLELVYRVLELVTTCRCLAKVVLSPQLFYDPEYWSGLGLEPLTPTQQTGVLPTELTRWW